MVRVYKYNLREDDVVREKVVKVLTVDYQEEDLHVWCMIDDDAEERELTFYVVPTGRDFELDGLNYVRTIFNGPFVWHLFYREKKLS